MAYDKEDLRAQVENGKIPKSLLKEIVPTQYDPDLQGPGIMHPEAADAMSALLAAAKEAGHPGLRVKYSYRTIDKQWEKWRDYQAGGNLAAYPGTSNHGWAVTGDMTWSQSSDIAWAHSNCQRFGYKFDVPSENWHMTYQGGYKPDKGEDDDVNLEKYTDGWDLYEERFKKQGKDPGPPPEDRDKWFKKGWNAARLAVNNPK